MTRVKICGITNPEDAGHAVSAGADAIGLVFTDSPRRVNPACASEIVAAAGPFVTPVALFVDSPAEFIIDVAGRLGLNTVQLHGDESPELVERLHPLRVIKAVRVADSSDLEGLERYRVDAFLLDTRVPGMKGGTGLTFDWSLAVEVARRFPIILAGGLNPQNVADAIRQVHPYAVDVSSGVEAAPGKKDPLKVSAFIENVRSA